MTDKHNVKEIRWLGGLPYPVAIIAIAGGLAAGLIIAFLPLRYWLVAVPIAGICMGISIGLSLKRWPPSGLKGGRV